MRAARQSGFGVTVACGLLLSAAACSSHSHAVRSDGGDDASASNPTDGGVVGEVDGGVGDTGLPTLPELTNVVVTQREDSIGIDFDPIDDAVDYRVYPLPKAGDITVNKDGSLTIKNAVYRCAGLRQTYDLPNNTTNNLTAPNNGQVYENANPQYSWTATIPTTPTLGYVNVTAGAGLVPVYAIGLHPTEPELGWRESRPKIYTTDAGLRTTLLANSGRDDGIVFYVPSAASASTTTIYHSENVASVGMNFIQYTESYFTAADMAAHMKDTTPPAPAFQVLTAKATSTQPLMAVQYEPGENHTELAVGNERFKRAANQGPGPLWHLEWSGITEPTTIVVEALASGCPFQGFLSPESLAAPPHQPLDTMAQIQAASPTGEVFINGQFDLPGTTFTVLTGTGFGVSDMGLPVLATPNSSPIPIARSFVQVAPQPHNPADWDWYEGFNVGSAFGTVVAAADTASCSCEPTSSAPCVSGGGGCGYWTSPIFNIGTYELDAPNSIPLFAYGQLLGQFWDVMDDTGQDVTGSTRFTATKQATVSSDANTFVHLTWSVNTVSTDRRYPQLIVSDQPSPVQDGFANPNSNTLLIQTKTGPSMVLEVEAFHGLVNGKPWAVNNQAPIHGLIDYDTWITTSGMPTAATGSPQPIPPAEPPFEHAGVDRMTRYDAYVSSNRLYVFMDGTPAGCTQYPSGGFALGGAVTVTFGDVLYHEGAQDELVCAGPRPYPFLHEHECSETKRHWDDLGFKSGVAAPKWDAVNFPCAAF